MFVAIVKRHCEGSAFFLRLCVLDLTCVNSITGETYTHQELAPVPYGMAREWISQTQSDTVFENEFGAPQDLDGSSSARVTAPAKVLYALRKKTRDKGMSLSALISSILEEYVSHRE